MSRYPNRHLRVLTMRHAAVRQDYIWKPRWQISLTEVVHFGTKDKREIRIYRLNSRTVLKSVWFL